MTDKDRDEQKPEPPPQQQPAPRVTPRVGPASSTDTTYPSRYIFDDYGFIPRRRP